MSRWFRWYEGTCEDGKFRVTARNAGVTVATVMGVWAAILENASNEDHRGIAVRECDFLAAILDVPESEMATILQCMEDVGLFSATEEGLLITKWKERQFETDASDNTNAERQRRWREKQKGNVNVTDRNGDVTAAKRPETETETETDKNISRVPALVFESDWPKDFREAFWQLFPKRVDKQAAFKKLEQLRRGGEVPWSTLIGGVGRYAESVRGKDQQYTKGPAAWLNAGKWDDEIRPTNSIVLPGGQRLDGWV